MNSNFFWQVFAREGIKTGGRSTGVGLIVIGFLLAPFVIGIPMIVAGVWKLFRS